MLQLELAMSAEAVSLSQLRMHHRAQAGEGNAAQSQMLPCAPEGHGQRLLQTT